MNTRIPAYLFCLTFSIEQLLLIWNIYMYILCKDYLHVCKSLNNMFFRTYLYNVFSKALARFWQTFQIEVFSMSSSQSLWIEVSLSISIFSTIECFTVKDDRCGLAWTQLMLNFIQRCAVCICLLCLACELWNRIFLSIEMYAKSSQKTVHRCQKRLIEICWRSQHNAQLITISEVSLILQQSSVKNELTVKSVCTTHMRCGVLN